MDIREKLERIRDLANQRIYAVQELDAVRTISQHNAQPGKTPLYMQGLVSTAEGFETPLSETEPVDFDFDLPADEVRWSAKKAKYHLQIETEGPALIDVYDENQDALIVSQRRSMGVAVIEVNVANARIEATRRITALRVDRFVSRTSGSIIVGPFHGEGRITAKAKGHGSWSTQVAAEPYIEGSYDNQSLDFTQDGAVYYGARPERLDEPPYFSGTEKAYPWSAVRRVPNDTDLSFGPEALQFDDSVVVGRRPHSFEEITVESPHRQEDGEEWWSGMGQWQAMIGKESPGLYRSAALWTYVWGSATGPIIRAYDMRTGHKAGDTSSRGFYLISTQEPAEVDVDGVHGKAGMPITKTYIRPGTYYRTEYYQYPDTFFIQVEGTGMLRELELEETSWFGPEMEEITKTRRIDLADFSEAGDDEETNMTVNDHGLMVFNTRG